MQPFCSRANILEKRGQSPEHNKEPHMKEGAWLGPGNKWAQGTVSGELIYTTITSLLLHGLYCRIQNVRRCKKLRLRETIH